MIEVIGYKNKESDREPIKRFRSWNDAIQFAKENSKKEWYECMAESINKYEEIVRQESFVNGESVYNQDIRGMNI